MFFRSKKGTVKHYHVHKTPENKYYLAENYCFESIPKLIHYHQHNSAGNRLCSFYLIGFGLGFWTSQSYGESLLISNVLKIETSFGTLWVELDLTYSQSI